MALRLTRPIQDNRALRLRGDPTVTSGAGLGARFGSELSDFILTSGRIQRAEGENVPGPFRGSVIEAFQPVDAPKISAEKLNKRYEGIGLKFDAPMTEEGARLLAEEKRAELIRNSIIRREPSGLTQGALGLGASLLSAAMDPLEIATALIPVVGQAKQAALIARLGAIRGRAAVGLIEGSVGNILTEPAYASLSRSLQRDYTMADSLTNVFIGGVLGGTLGAGIGAGSRVRARLRARIADLPTRLDQETQITDTLFHGTDTIFSEFDQALARAGDRGIYFTWDRTLAAVHGRIIREAQVKVQNPLVIDVRRRGLVELVREQFLDKRTRRRAESARRREAGRKSAFFSEEEVQELKDKGFDSVVNKATREVVVFSPEQFEFVDELGSLAARGQALRSAIAQAAQGKQVQVQGLVRAIEDKRSINELGGRIKELERQEKFTNNILRRAKRPEVIEQHKANLERIGNELQGLRRQLAAATADSQRRLQETIDRTAQTEGAPERSSLYEPEQVSRLNEEAKKPDVPEDDEVSQEIQDLERQLDNEVEAGRLTPEQVEQVKAELKGFDDKVVAMSRAAEFMKTCLRS